MPEHAAVTHRSKVILYGCAVDLERSALQIGTSNKRVFIAGHEFLGCQVLSPSVDHAQAVQAITRRHVADVANRIGVGVGKDGWRIAQCAWSQERQHQVRPAVDPQ